MVDKFNVYQICPHCHGTGEVDVTITTPDPDDSELEIGKKTCINCNGVGEVEWGRMEEDVA